MCVHTRWKYEFNELIVLNAAGERATAHTTATSRIQITFSGLHTTSLTMHAYAIYASTSPLVGCDSVCRYDCVCSAHKRHQFIIWSLSVNKPGTHLFSPAINV